MFLARLDGQSARMNRYKPNFTKGSLLIQESRVIARLLLEEVSDEAWKAAIVDRNLLQKRTRNTALTYAWLIRRRLEEMSRELWMLVSDAPLPVATSAMFAATVKHSPLLGDFITQVVAEQYRKFEPRLRRSLWDHYLEECRDRDPAVAAWSAATQAKLRQNAWRMLAEAGYVRDTRSLELLAVHPPQEVISYLESNQEQYVLRCMQVGQCLR
jgi:hypothetical protein